jgi:transcriptional regulator with XRE-family HTH domain
VLVRTVVYPDSIVALLGEVLRARRIAIGISQEDLADRSGLHRTYISDLERGVRNVTVKNIFRLAKALGVPASALIQQVELRKNTE